MHRCPPKRSLISWGRLRSGRNVMREHLRRHGAKESITYAHLHKSASADVRLTRLHDFFLYYTWEYDSISLRKQIIFVALVCWKISLQLLPVRCTSRASRVSRQSSIMCRTVSWHLHLSHPGFPVLSRSPSWVIRVWPIKMRAMTRSSLLDNGPCGL